MAVPVDGAEPIARFVFRRKGFIPSKRQVRPTEFLPPPDGGETSVFRVMDLSEEAIWRLGEEVGKERQKLPKGRAQFVAAGAGRVGLHLDADDDPPRHANLVGWPATKPERLTVAQRLAAECEIHLRSEGNSE